MANPDHKLETIYIRLASHDKLGHQIVRTMVSRYTNLYYI